MAHTIGLVMSDIEHSLFTSIFEGAQEICDDEGFQLIGMNSYSDKSRQYEAVRHLCQMRVSGILLSSVHDSAAEITLAKEAGIPLVVIDHTNPLSAPIACSVLENNRAGGEMAAAELIETGRRKLLFVGHSLSDFQAIRERWEGATHYIKHANVYSSSTALNTDIPTLQFTDSGGIMMEDGYAVGQKIVVLPEQERPDAIIAATDFLACGLVNAFIESGQINVPEDIAIIGMEGNRLDAICLMPLTVIQSPGNDMGRQAMRQLLNEMDSPSSHLHATLSLMPTLVRRSTTPRRNEHN